jgi:hypothetical protein
MTVLIWITGGVLLLGGLMPVLIYVYTRIFTKAIKDGLFEKSLNNTNENGKEKEEK